jgi:uncharacterized protein (DUF58 family)
MERIAIATALKDCVRRWALRRQGKDVLPLTLVARRIYIVPTRAGWVFGLLLAVMFIAGMNYGNGLALLLTFWLVGFMLVAMVQTQQQLSGLTLLRAAAEPAFAGGTLQLTLSFRSAPGLPNVEASLAGKLHSASRDAPGKRSADTLTLSIPVTQRGLWRAPTIRLQSTAPYGLFRTWAWLNLDCETLVYPRPYGDQAEPLAAGQQRGAHHMVQNPDELAWLRDFREGDSPRQVAWKAYARGAPLLVREYRGTAAAERDFDYAALSRLDTEGRLSQLCKWVLDAARRNESWTLRMPSSTPRKGFGQSHRDQCLRQLALHDLPGYPGP